MRRLIALLAVLALPAFAATEYQSFDTDYQSYGYVLCQPWDQCCQCNGACENAYIQAQTSCYQYNTSADAQLCFDAAARNNDICHMQCVPSCLGLFFP